MTTSISTILSDVKFLNVICRPGEYMDSIKQEVAEDKRCQVAQYLPKESLAYKILYGTSVYSQKQLCVIAYELQKNAEYCELIEAEAKKLEADEILRARTRHARRNPLENGAPRVRRYKVGLRVNSGRYGKGTILEVFPGGSVRVKFDFCHDEKRLITRFAHLTQVPEE